MVQQGEVSNRSLMVVKTMRIPESYKRPEADSSDCSYPHPVVRNTHLRYLQSYNLIKKKKGRITKWNT